MNSNEIIIEAQKLHQLGLAVHWLHPKSKTPVASGWPGSQRPDWKTLKSQYVKGYNLGIRLGEPSKIDGGYLAVFDLDIRDEAFQREAVAEFEKNFPGMYENLAIALTGRGNGSAHLYFQSDELLQSRKIASAKHKVRVFSPSTKLTDSTKSECLKAGLSIKEINEGWRLKKAWEIDLMCAGRQVVAPPSIHPDTNVVYRWERRFF